MCGIAGKLIFNRSIVKEDLDMVIKIRDSLYHRGPDDFGIFTNKNVILAHRRLSIIDLSEKGKQPMSSNDNRFHITYNGEIYNFKEIRSKLKEKGYFFNTKTDTEVIIYAYSEYGEECLGLFNGMFAFAIWDSKEESLFIARDRFGKKPFYYYKNSDALTFASEIKAIRKDSTIKLKLSPEAVNCYLALGYILNPVTMYEDLFCLEPGSYIKMDKYGKIIKREYYWDYSRCFRNKHLESEKDIQTNIITLLKAAIKRRMISDVPVGAFLSGGIDSSSIVALMKEYHNGELHTFSVGFNRPSYNELPDADRVAKYLNTFHHGLIVDKKNQMQPFLDEIIEVSDQLYSDNSLIPMLEVSRLAAKNVTVVLSGDGADELFAGYITYSADRLYKKAIILPLCLRKMLSNETVNFIPFSKNKINLDYKRKQFFNGTMKDYRGAHYMWRQLFSEKERIEIMGKAYTDLIYDTDPFIKFNKYYEKVSDLNELDQHLYVDAMTWLTDDILPKVDRSTMFSSIEARAPYLDVELAEYTAGIPVDIKFKRGIKKAILKSSLKNILPEFVLQKKKSGFNAPVYDWIPSEQSNEFKDFNLFIYRNFVKNR